MRRGLLLDCDGVLADLELDGHRRAFNDVWVEEGVPWQWTRASYLKALQVAGGHERLLALSSDPAFRAAVGSLERFGDWKATTKRWHHRKTELLADYVRTRGVVGRPGVRRIATEALAADWRLAVVSSGARGTVEAISRQVLGDEIVDHTELVCSEDVGTKKPSPECYQVAIKRIEVHAAHAFAIEDTDSGAAAAVRAGISCVVTATARTLDEPFTGAVAILDSLGDSPAVEAKVRTAAGWNRLGFDVHLDDLEEFSRSTTDSNRPHRSDARVVR